MSEDNDAAATPEAEPEVNAAKPESVNKNQESTEAKGPDATSTGKSNPASEKERQETFGIYQMALENVDWGYKLKSGDERDIGHRSMVIAERAFIAAGVFDQASTNKIYEQYAGRPPKDDLIKRAEDHRQALNIAGNTHSGVSIPDLTADIAKIGERRDHSKLHTTKDEIEKKLGTWNSVLGDADSRTRQHMKAANDQMLKQEKPRDDGMHIFAAFRSGMRAGEEYGEMMLNRKVLRPTLETVREQRDAHAKVTKQIAAFGKVEGVTLQDTTGANGQNVARFQKAFGVVKSDMSKRTPAPGMETPPSAVQSVAQKAAAMAARNAGVGR